MKLLSRFLTLGVVVFFYACKDKDSVTPVVPVVPTTPTVPVVVPTGLDVLPNDTGGTHTANVLGSDDSPYGYYLYTPSGYTSTGPKFPLVIFLHGSGEIGNSQTNAAALSKVLVNGPPRLVRQGKWDPKYPMMVASPQCHDDWWNWEKVHNFINFIRTTYQVDTTRIYITGISMGGFGTWDQLISFGADSYVAAAVPIAGSGNVTDAFALKASAIPIWAFHGEMDPTVSPAYDLAMIPKVNAVLPTPKVKAKLTMYPDTGHDSWTKTYDGSGMGTEDPQYDPFDMDVFTWMLQYQKN